VDIARVVGSVVATRKYRTLTGMKLALIQPLDEELKGSGEPIVAVDLESRCGLGELVFFVEGGDAALLELDEATGKEKFIPSDASIVGIIDTLDADREFKTQPGGFAQYRK